MSNLSTTSEGQPEWLRVKEACDCTRLSKPKLYDLMNRGLLRFVSLREEGQKKGTRLIHHATLRTFLESRAVGGEGRSVREPDHLEKGTVTLTYPLPEGEGRGAGRAASPLVPPLI